MNSKIVIIGTGAAGIAAATKLLKLGFQNVILLEAQGRIGGRIFTTPFASNVVDLGAQWCHGEKDNVVFEIANKKGFLGSSGELPFHCIKSNKDVVPQSISDRLQLLSMGLLDDEKALINFEQSLGNYLQERYYAALKNPEYADIDQKTAEQFFEFYKKFENSIECSDTLFDVSAKGYLQYRNCDGDILLNWKDKGYITILHTLMNSSGAQNDFGVLNQKISFNKRVEQIQWDGKKSSTIIIECSDGDKIEADHVICTVSLGVLKEKHSDLFEPPLPKKKLRAIEGLSIGTVNKVFLEFSQIFWESNDWPGFCLLWDKTDLDQIRKGKYSWLEDVFAFFTVDYQPNVLCAWTYGANAREMETVSDAEVQEGLVLLLKKFLKWNIPNPVNMKRSAWYTNPNFRGSYSYRSMKSEELQTYASDLASPLKSTSHNIPVVLFAGEATHDHYYSTVHGAIESGWREAHRLADFYNSTYVKNIYDVLIIGGGLAGLGAGYALKNKTLKFAILEAQNQIGGRVQTRKMKNFKMSSVPPQNPLSDTIDSGAQWLHGEQNEIYRIAKRMKLLAPELSEEGLGLYIREDGFVFDDLIHKKVNFIVGCILERCETFINSKDYPKSLEDYIENEFDKYLQILDDKSLQEQAKQLFDWHRRFQIIDNSCFSLKDVSAKFWGSYSYNGESCQAHINFKRGFSSLIDVVAEEIGLKNIITEKEVCRVNWNVLSNEQQLIKVHTADNELYYAKHVIVTLPLGVLKSKEQKLFCPVLPQSIRNCIRDIGFAPINKIFLQFEEPWWDKTPGIQLIFVNDNYKDKPWTRYLSGFDVLKPGAPNTLLGWVGSYGAIEMEKLTDENIILDCVEVLRKFTGIDVPLPIRYHCSRWGSNKFIQGGYSYISTICDKSGLTGRSLSTPVTIANLCNDKDVIDKLQCLNLNNQCYEIKNDAPLLLFAGEACHDKYFSTAHGAFISGMQQAQVILKYFE